MSVEVANKLEDQPKPLADRSKKGTVLHKPAKSEAEIVSGKQRTDDPDLSHWRVWKTAAGLEEERLGSLEQNLLCQQLTRKVASILRLWGRKWAKLDGMVSFLNKSSLKHEVEESIVALMYLMQWLDQRTEKEPVTVVDVCCGKGIFSMLLSFVFMGDDTRVNKIIMLDKASIDWKHVKLANKTCEEDERPFIEAWERCNLYERDGLLDKFESLQSPLALVGIHLCKSLGPTCVGLVNGLGDKCPFLCLAPCCLPRVAIGRSRKKQRVSQRTIDVPLYESPQDRQNRRSAMRRREEALGRGKKSVCHICHGSDHPSISCHLLPKDNEEARIAMLKAATALVPCWRCGVVGHFKAQCTAEQSSSKPTHKAPPAFCMDVSKVIEAEKPFDTYCELLAESLQRHETQIVETGLKNSQAQHQEGNWNSSRKSIYIIATQ